MGGDTNEKYDELAQDIKNTLSQNPLLLEYSQHSCLEKGFPRKLRAKILVLYILSSGGIKTSRMIYNAMVEILPGELDIDDVYNAVSDLSKGDDRKIDRSTPPGRKFYKIRKGW